MRFAKTANAVFGLAISHRKLLWCRPKAGETQLVEHEALKLGVAGSNPVAHSMHSKAFSAILAFSDGRCYDKVSFS